MRQYETIWYKLKTEHRVSVSSPRHYHKRIIKAVKKEKWKDLVFKLTLAELGRSARLSAGSSGPVVTFILQIAIPLDLDAL